MLLAAAAGGWVARRLTLPTVIGYLVVGVAVSPFTPGYVADREHLQLLADVGVVLLLFEVGIEVDLLRLRREHRGLRLVAPAQTILTTVLAGATFMLAGLGTSVALTMGLCLALSSSVVMAWLLSPLGGWLDPARWQSARGQMGEFSFVLGSLLASSGAIPPELHAAVLAAVVLSIGLAAVAVRLPVAGWVRWRASCW